MHYYQHNIKDFRSGVINFTRAERWLYRDMLEVYYDKERPLPLELLDVCDAIGASQDEADSVAKILRTKFNRTETGWVNERCEEELFSYRMKADAARQNGKKGGRPPKNNPAKTQQVSSGLQAGSHPVATGIPAETGSKANQEPITNNQKPDKDNYTPPASNDIAAQLVAIAAGKTKPATAGASADAEPWFSGIDAQVVKDFKALRKAKKAAITATAMAMLQREAQECSMTMEQAMRVCCERGWTTVKREWLERRNGAAPGGGNQRPSMHSGFDKRDYTAGVAEDGTF